MGYIDGEDRKQTILFPEALDDYVSDENPVRFMDAFVESLDMKGLGFERAIPKEEGRPGYNPRDLLRLYVYGYVNEVRSSRKLERETGRNVELMWLMRKLRPDHKTIADFRKDNLEAIKKVYGQFTQLCRRMGLVSGELIAVDGGKFRAVNSRERNFSRKKLEQLQSNIERRIEDYLKSLDESDANEEGKGLRGLSAEEMKEKLEELKKRKNKYGEIKKKLDQSGQPQVSLTDPDARRMITRQGVHPCYNVQIATDSKHKLIVAQEVTNAVEDKGQLESIAGQAKEVLGVERIEVLADMGYYNGSQVKLCEEKGITAYIQKPPVNNRGLFTKEQFKYEPVRDVYVCPAGKELRYWSYETARQLRCYTTDDCLDCEIRKKCTRSELKRIMTRRPDEGILEQMAVRVRDNPQKMKLRKAFVEHPFGTIKRWMNQGYFLTRGKSKVAAEMSLTAMAYNMKRAMNILGVQTLLKALE
jgi:transposase